MLVKKVENHAEFVAARHQGSLYFRGYFLRCPEMMTTHDVPAKRINYMRMLEAVSRPELDVPRARPADQDRSFHLLPVAALHELGQVWFQA
jgi:c-di-GMP-related signal transduction protein